MLRPKDTFPPDSREEISIIFQKLFRKEVILKFEGYVVSTIMQHCMYKFRLLHWSKSVEWFEHFYCLCN